MVPQLSGGCLCQAVRYVLTQRVRLNPYACHCTDCQRRTGSAFGIQLMARRRLRGYRRFGKGTACPSERRHCTNFCLPAMLLSRPCDERSPSGTDQPQGRYVGHKQGHDSAFSCLGAEQATLDHHPAQTPAFDMGLRPLKTGKGWSHRLHKPDSSPTTSSALGPPARRERRCATA